MHARRDLGGHHGLAVQLSKQVTFWKLPAYVPRASTSLPPHRPLGRVILLGLLCLLCLLAGMVIGIMLPTMIQNRLPLERGFYYPQPLDVLGQLATIVGGVCGAYVGVRGSRLWVVLGPACGGIYVAKMAVDTVF